MIGVALGQGFDQAVTLCVKSWKILALSWVVLGTLFVFDKTQALGNIAWLVWTPVGAAIVGRAQRPDFRFSVSSALRFYGAVILSGGAPVFVVAVVAAIVIPNLLHAQRVGSLSPGLLAAAVITFVIALAFVCWFGIRFSMAGISTFYDRYGVFASMARSYRLTQGRFWQTFGFCALATIAQWALTFVPAMVLGAIFGYVSVTFYHVPLSRLSESTSFITGALVPVMMYTAIALFGAYVRWLDWLERTSSSRITTAA